MILQCTITGMLRLYFCTVDQHDVWFLGFAAIVCLATSISALMMFRLARQARRNRWLPFAGFATGFGFWATHFIAMMGYIPAEHIAYRVLPTVTSLILSLAFGCAGFVVGARVPGRTGALGAGLLMAGGVAAMHLVGVSALALSGLIRFDPWMVLAALGWGGALMVPAFSLVRNGRGFVAACLLLCLAVIGLHLVGMAAVALEPSRPGVEPHALLLPQTMSVLVGTVAVGVVLAALALTLHARRIDAAVHATERDFAILVKGISDCALYMLTPDGTIANWNAGAERLKGYKPAEVIGKPLAIFYTAQDRADGVCERALATARTEGKFTGAGWRCRKDGSVFWAHVSIERITDETGQMIGFAKITRDMTRWQEQQLAIEQTRARLDTALDNMHHGLALFDQDHRLVLSNSRLSDMWGAREGSLAPGTGLDSVVRSLLEGRAVPAGLAEQDNVHDMLRQAILAMRQGVPAIECRDRLHVSVSSRALPQGGWVSTFEDVTETRRSEARIAYLAMHDALTGLPNRTHFAEWCAREIDHAARHGLGFAMVAIDLDRFKEINDTWGHAEGDKVIAEVGRRLRAVPGEAGIVARLGGDEFAAAGFFSTEAELSDFVERLSACFDDPIDDGAKTIPAGASIGVAVAPGDGRTLEVLLNNADLAMYRAKTGLDEGICYYQPDMDETARTRRQIASDLRHALERGEFHLVYQPQHEVRTGRRIGYEALLRWGHPVRGLVAPLDFIPIAEETGTIFAIGEWVLREACAAATQWHDQDMRIAVNLSPVQLQRPDLVDTIRAVLLETGLSARRLELEITESAIIADKVRTLHILRQIRALGISIAMDDFGTGYSSLDTLHSFPFDKIKIDKSFLLGSLDSEQSAAIVRAVLSLGRSLNIPVLAEGVETDQQLAFLTREGCEEAQGYYYGRPAIITADGEMNMSVTDLGGTRQAG